jgi:hypothetical protein
MLADLLPKVVVGFLERSSHAITTSLAVVQLTIAVDVACEAAYDAV